MHIGKRVVFVTRHFPYDGGLVLFGDTHLALPYSAVVPLVTRNAAAISEVQKGTMRMQVEQVRKRAKQVFTGFTLK